MTFVLQPVFLSKEERAALAIQRRQEAIVEQRKLATEERKAHQKFVEGASSSRRSGRWEEDRSRQREDTLTEKDKQKEMDAIKVTTVRYMFVPCLCY